MVAKTVAPDRGEIVWISLGRRPVLVLSPRAYNQKAGLVLCCPITGQQKGYPFEVELPADAPVTGVIMADQVECLDWRTRKAEVAGTASSDAIAETLGKLASLLQ